MSSPLEHVKNDLEVLLRDTQALLQESKNSGAEQVGNVYNLSTLFDHDDGAGTHVHLADSFQPVGLLPETPSELRPSGANRQLSLSIDPPLDIFLVGLLRPPQALL